MFNFRAARCLRSSILSWSFVLFHKERGRGNIVHCCTLSLWYLGADDQHRNPNINNKDHLVGRLFRGNTLWSQTQFWVLLRKCPLMQRAWKIKGANWEAAQFSQTRISGSSQSKGGFLTGNNKWKGSASWITPRGAKAEVLTRCCNFPENFHPPPFDPIKVWAKMQQKDLVDRGGLKAWYRCNYHNMVNLYSSFLSTLSKF